MPLCKNCGSTQLHGTIFCDECGANLLTGERTEKDTHSLKPTPAACPAGQPSRSSAPAPQKPAKSTAPMQGQPITSSSIVITVTTNGRQQLVDISAGALVGRAHDNGKVVPDIDLGQDGGFDAGISRRHAIISLRGNICVVEDLESSNGTFINGRRLLPHQPFPLHTNDELRFGTLTLRIEAAP